MNRKLDKLDGWMAAALAAVIALWAFAWAHPYPHPNLWPFLATFSRCIPLAALSVLGKVAIGMFAGLVYLVMREAWIRFRDIEDELPDNFFFVRFCTLCGAAIIALSPYVWRAAQFLSPGFVLVVLTTFAMLAWQRGCGCQNLALSMLAYVIFAFVAGVEPLGVAALAYVSICDILRRWQNSQEHGQQSDDIKAMRQRSSEMSLSVFGVVVGFGCAIYLGAAYYAGGRFGSEIVSVVLTWWHGWYAAGMQIMHSLNVVVIAVGIGLATTFLALGRRLRFYGPSALTLSVSLTSILTLITLIFFLRAIDVEECTRLELMRDYVHAVLADSEGADWLFTDGRFNDALRYEVKHRGSRLRVINALTPPSKAESELLKTMAPEPGDVDLFVAGGSEIFKAWARERPDRIAVSAWQLGTAIVRRFDKVSALANGSVMRSNGAIGEEASLKANGEFVQLTRRIREVLERPSTVRSLLGGVDNVVAERFDALVWRAARMAGERSETAAKAGDAKAAESERATMIALDSANCTLRAQGSVIERLLPTANLVLTPKEALEISLKRADFTLAQRYAREVLVSSPDDVGALFALGMANLEAGEFFSASRYLERVIQLRPNEPAVLNNLALAYLKLDKLEAAYTTVERALKANPTSKEIQKNLEAIKKAQKK